jgi:hypothetical protein
MLSPGPRQRLLILLTGRMNSIMMKAVELVSGLPLP